MALSLLFSGCAVRPFVVDQTAQALSAQPMSSEDDLQLAREASAFYLKFSESVLKETPGHLKLAESVSAGFTQYAYAFVAFDAEKIDTKNPKVAAQMRERAARLYARAHRHAMVALERSHPGFGDALRKPDTKNPLQLTKTQVPLAYWAAASLGGWISMSKDAPDLVADLPLSMRLAELAWQTNPTYGQGALASLMGTLEAAKVGGSRPKAQAYFDQAIALSQGKEAGPLVAKAEGVALPAEDRKQFEQLLQQALAISQAHRSLQNEVMRERAQWLLSSVDELF
ncbi:TRAP transporter TatT component family protein [Limnohabitans curvus]|nr:TRAP transporter TatT component family protein [Limnohabitans curvus]